MAQDYKELRDVMVETQLKNRKIRSKVVLDAMRTIPRHLFVPSNMQNYASQGQIRCHVDYSLCHRSYP